MNLSRNLALSFEILAAHKMRTLLSVLGGVTALGPIGIFVGPMIVVFLLAVLNMLHTELDSLGKALPTKG